MTGPMENLKERVARQLDDLSPDELRVVHQLIATFKQPTEPRQLDRDALQQVRDALAHVPGSLSETIRDERDDRI